MHRIIKAAIIGSVVAISGCDKSQEYKTLSSMELETLLKGNTVDGVLVAQSLPFKQYFGANGVTVQVIQSKRTGTWQVGNNNEFCIRWSTAKGAEKNGRKTDTQENIKTNIKKTDSAQCYSIKQDDQGRYLVYSANLGHAATLRKVVPGDPRKL